MHTEGTTCIKRQAARQALMYVTQDSYGTEYHKE